MGNGKNTILIIIILSTIFGLGSGIVGSIVARVYILEDALNLPLFGEIDFSSSRYGGSSLVISGAKKVVVEQNDKVTETLNSVKSNILGIYDKKATGTRPLSEKISGMDLVKNYYNLDEELGQAFILTSDGWIVSSFYPVDLSRNKTAKETAAEEAAKSRIFEKYAVISKNKEIFEVDEIIIDPKTNFAFWHIKAEGLPVKKFITRDDVSNGDLVISINWDGWTWISSIVEKDFNNNSAVKDSDISDSLFKLAEEPTKDFYGSFLFNLNGDALALIDQKGGVEPIYNYTACINCLLESKDIRRPSLGVYYIDLSDFAGIDKPAILSKGALIVKNESGAAIKKDSPASIAGLREGDVIISVDNTELDGSKTLSAVISQYQVDDEISLVYERAGVLSNTTLKLDELK